MAVSAGGTEVSTKDVHCRPHSRARHIVTSGHTRGTDIQEDLGWPGTGLCSHSVTFNVLTDVCKRAISL